MNSKKFILSLTLLAICLGIATQVRSECLQLTRQYFECKNLKMVKSALTHKCHYYRPDKSQPNNTLDDSFYQTLGLSDMNFNEAMDMIRGIYQENENCSNPEFCDCVNKRLNGPTFWKQNNSILFLNDTNYQDSLNIVSQFIERYSADIKSDEKIEQIYVRPKNNLPTLNKFCMANEYTFYRACFYNYSIHQCFDHSNLFVSFIINILLIYFLFH